MTSGAILNAASNVLNLLIECGWQAGLIILIVLAIRAAFTQQLTGRWLYALWLIVMLRLALPWVPETHWNPLVRLPNIQWKDKAKAPAQLAPFVTKDITNTTPDGNISLPQPDSQTPSSIVLGAHTASATIEPLWTPLSIITTIWVLGVVILGGLISFKVARFHHSILLERLLTNAPVLDLLEDCKRLMGITAPVVIVTTEKVNTPTLFGFIRPRLLIPASVLESLEPQELRHVFLHELAHLKRHDVLIGWAMCVLQVLHWFNPLVWLAQNRMRADRELACDALVLKTLRPGDPKAYGNTVVRLLERFSRPQLLPALTGILEDNSQLRRRISMIAHFKPQSRLATFFAVGLSSIVALLALTTAPSIAASETRKPEATATAPNTAKPAKFSPNKVYTIIPGTGLELLKIGAAAQQVQEVFGSPTEKKEFDRSYKLSYKNTCVDFIIGQESNTVSEIHFNEGFRGRLENGIRIGCTLDMLLSKIGPPSKKANASPEEARSMRMGSDRVLYTQRMGREIVSYKFADAKQGMNYWFDKDKKLTQVVVYRPQGTDSKQLTPAELPEGSHINKDGHIVDRIDWPFVNDPAAIGKWESVDFVRDMDQFTPGKKNWKGDLFFKGLTIIKNGKTNLGFMTWTKGLLMHKGDKTASIYIIKKFDGKSYMFMEWKSGDYVRLHQRPSYYVLRKQADSEATNKDNTPEQAAIESANAWLEVVDKGDYAKSWAEAATAFRTAVTQDTWKTSLHATRSPLGKTISRKLQSQQYTKSLPGTPDGQYVVIQYETKFENKAEAVETVTPMLDKDGKWRVSGYYIK